MVLLVVPLRGLACLIGGHLRGKPFRGPAVSILEHVHSVHRFWNPQHHVLPMTHFALTSGAQVKVVALGALVAEPDNNRVAAIADHIRVDRLIFGLSRLLGALVHFHALDAVCTRRRRGLLGWGRRGLFVVAGHSLNLDMDLVLEQVLTVDKHPQVVHIDDRKLGTAFVWKKIDSLGLDPSST